MTNNILYFFASKLLIISKLTFAFPISPYSLSFYIGFDNFYSTSTLNVFLSLIIQPVPSDFPPHKFFIINLKMLNYPKFHDQYHSIFLCFKIPHYEQSNVRLPYISLFIKLLYWLRQFLFHFNFECFSFSNNTTSAL